MRRTIDRWAAAGLLLLLQGLASGTQMYYGLDELRDLERAAIVDRQGVVQRHTLLGFSNHACRDEFGYARGFPWNYTHLPGEMFELGQIMVDDPANELMAFFGVADCSPYVFLPRGAPLEAHRGGKHKLAPKDRGELQAWVDGFLRAPGFRLKNDQDYPVVVLLETQNQEAAADVMQQAIYTETKLLELGPGEEKRLDEAVKGQTLVWRKKRTDKKAWGSGSLRLLARAVVTDGAAAGGGMVLSELLARAGDTEALQLTDEDVKVWRGRLRTNMRRIRQIELQPPTKTKYTEVGFKHLKMPRALHEHLVAFRGENEGQRKDEPWQREDVHVNHFETVPTQIRIDAAVTEVIVEHVQPLLEEWAGIALEHKNTEGIRCYHNNSRLRDHTDNKNFFVGAILNVAQDADEPWPLHILDHNGRRHFLEMEAGDMVLFESARCSHGRPYPLLGRSFDNIFTHFRPPLADQPKVKAPATKLPPPPLPVYKEQEAGDVSEEEEGDGDGEEDEHLWAVQDEMLEEGSEEDGSFAEEM